MAVQTLTASANGASQAILVKSGQNLIRVRNAAAWAGESVALEFSDVNDPSTFEPVIDGDGAVVFTANGSRIVPTGLWYRMNVTGHAGSDIVLTPVFAEVD